MKKILILAFSLFTLGTYAQREVPQSRMEQIYEEAKTPYKYGLAVAPADNKHKIDCPTVFREGDKWYMTYVVYNGKSGLDGRGYETWIAESDNLLEWRTLGRVLSYLIVTDSGIATSVVVSLHCRIWSGEEAMPCRRIKASIG